jgi:glycosyltransferase involved in cell wall biosynthesis
MSGRICVVTPCLNAGDYLRDCLESVRGQGDIVQRHIVIDGGSTDGSLGLLKEFSRQYSSLEWVSERDTGQSDALQKGLARVDTAHFGWLNADDVYLPGGLRRLLASAQKGGSDEPGIVYGDYLILDAESRESCGATTPSAFV